MDVRIPSAEETRTRREECGADKVGCGRALSCRPDTRTRTLAGHQDTHPGRTPGHTPWPDTRTRSLAGHQDTQPGRTPEHTAWPDTRTRNLAGRQDTQPGRTTGHAPWQDTRTRTLAGHQDTHTGRTPGHKEYNTPILHDLVRNTVPHLCGPWDDRSKRSILAGLAPRMPPGRP